MLKAYKYRIYPTLSQIDLIEKSFGCCRLVYNLALQVKIDAYKANGTRLSAFDLCYQLIELKDEYKWLRDVDSQALQASVKKVDVAFKGFFNGKGYPKFKKKTGRNSFQSPHPTNRRIDFDKGFLSIAKLNNIPIVISRTFEGNMKTVTISKSTTGKYFASILVDNGIQFPDKRKFTKETSIGIDLGVKTFATISDGTIFENPSHLRKQLTRLSIEQRKLDRRYKKGVKTEFQSKGWHRQKLVVAKLHEKISNQRSDFLHRTSINIIRNNNTVCMEDLNVLGMLKNHNLAKSISDVSWSEFKRQLEYKADWYGKNIITIGRFEPSSKLCSNCGYINKELTLADRNWNCPKCNTRHKRDENAAENIKNFGLRAKPSTAKTSQ